MKKADECSDQLGHEYAATLSDLRVTTKKKRGGPSYSANVRIQCRHCGKTLRGVVCTGGALHPVNDGKSGFDFEAHFYRPWLEESRLGLLDQGPFCD